MKPNPILYENWYGFVSSILLNFRVVSAINTNGNSSPFDLCIDSTDTALIDDAEADALLKSSFLSNILSIYLINPESPSLELLSKLPAYSSSSLKFAFFFSQSL